MTGSNSESIVEGTARVSGQWMTIGDAAAALGISEKTLRRKREANFIKTKRMGESANSKIYFWINDEVRQLLSNNRIETDGFEDVLATAIDIDEPTESEIVDEHPGAAAQSAAAQSAAPPPSASQTAEQSQQQQQQQAFKDVLQEYMRPLVARVEEQAIIIHERDKKIEDLEIQMRLLPDKQKEEADKKQAALDSVNAELKGERDLREQRESELEKMQARIADLERSEQELMAENNRPAWKKWFGIKS